MTVAYTALRLQFLLRKRRNAGTPGTARKKHCRVRRSRGAARYRSHRKLSRQEYGRENGNAHLGGKAALP